MCTSRWRCEPPPISIPAIPPTIFPASITSPLVGCFAFTCAGVYIVSFGPIESANTYDGVFTIFPEEQEPVIAAPLAHPAPAARAERHDASSARRIGTKPTPPRGIRVTPTGSVDYR